MAGGARAFGACCFAGKLRSPAGPGPVPRWPRPLTPTLVGTLVFNPQGFLVAILEDADQAEQAKATLAEAGFAGASQGRSR